MVHLSHILFRKELNGLKILILSCDTGEGHNSAGKAIKEAAEHKGHSVTMIDMFLLSGKGTSHAVSGAYIGIVKHIPFFFGLLYKVGMLISSDKRKSPVYFANALLCKKLSAYIESNGFDAVVTPHLYPAETLSCMKQKNLLHIPAVAVGTDYTCIPFWEETNMDYYVIPHDDLTDEFAKRGIPENKLLPLGIPVRQSFCTRTSKAAARTRLHLPSDVPIFLVMSGSMGFGKLAVFAAELAIRCHNNEHIVIICGNNTKIKRILQNEFKFNKRVHVIGYTNQVSLFMDACDVIYTKPGGLTSTEALVKNIPIVHTAPIPGCETANVAFFKKRHLSVSSKRLSKQIELGKIMIENKELNAEMIRAQRRERKPYAAIQIVGLLEELTHTNTTD